MYLFYLQAHQDTQSVKKDSKPKKLTGRCWMAENFPMSLRQLLPLLDVVGHANKHLAKVAKFMRKYGDMNMFPVKIQVMSILCNIAWNYLASELGSC